MDNGVIFRAEWYRMIMNLPEEQRLSAYKAIMDYQFTHEPLPDDFPAELRQAVMEDEESQK